MEKYSILIVFLLFTVADTMRWSRITDTNERKKMVESILEFDGMSENQGSYYTSIPLYQADQSHSPNQVLIVCRHSFKSQNYYSALELTRNSNESYTLTWASNFNHYVDSDNEYHMQRHAEEDAETYFHQLQWKFEAIEEAEEAILPGYQFQLTKIWTIRNKTIGIYYIKQIQKYCFIISLLPYQGITVTAQNLESVKSAKLLYYKGKFHQFQIQVFAELNTYMNNLPTQTMEWVNGDPSIPNIKTDTREITPSDLENSVGKECGYGTGDIELIEAKILNNEAEILISIFRLAPPTMWEETSYILATGVVTPDDTFPKISLTYLGNKTFQLDNIRASSQDYIYGLAFKDIFKNSKTIHWFWPGKVNVDWAKLEADILANCYIPVPKGSNIFVYKVRQIGGIEEGKFIAIYSLMGELFVVAFVHLKDKPLRLMHISTPGRVAEVFEAYKKYIQFEYTFNTVEFKNGLGLLPNMPTLISENLNSILEDVRKNLEGLNLNDFENDHSKTFYFTPPFPDTGYRYCLFMRKTESRHSQIPVTEASPSPTTTDTSETHPEGQNIDELVSRKSATTKTESVDCGFYIVVHHELDPEYPPEVLSPSVQSLDEATQELQSFVKQSHFATLYSTL